MPKIEINGFIYKGIDLENGKPCPHCGRTIEVYRRSLQKLHAQTLVNMYKSGQNEWQHYTEFQPEGFNDYGKLKYWKLIEQLPNSDQPKKLESGSWRLTYKGIEFLCGRGTISKYIFTYDDTVLEVQDGERITFTELFGQKFDVRETFTSPEQLDLMSYFDKVNK